MPKICIQSALLLLLLYTSIEGQNSPCPDRFTYIKKPGSDETIGQVEIRNPLINNLEVHLKVDFKVAIQLPTTFVGGVNLTKSKEDAARDVLEGRPLFYYIYFPVQNPLPTVHRIWFNNHQICFGSEVSGNVVTTITLEHNLKIIMQLAQNQPNPPQNKPAEQNPMKLATIYFDIQTNQSHNIVVTHSLVRQLHQELQININDPILRPNTPRSTSASVPNVNPTFTPRTPQQTPQPAPVDENENYNECGINNSSGSPRLLIAHGNKTLPGQWPWVAAIFRVIRHYEFVCGGNLLTTKHVLTAGHCLIDPDTSETIPANILSVALGRYKLMNFTEPESVTVNVATYNFHPEYTHTTTADSDLAILILSYPVEFTAFIKPICLWSPLVDPHRLEQEDGIVVGWGGDEHGSLYTEEPRLAIMPLVKRDECLLSHQSFYNLVSRRTFCAGGQNLTVSGICNGDSGSGLVVFDSATGRYQLRGVVSRKPLGHQLFCDRTHFIVFVDVFKYLPWINRQKYST